MNTAQINPRAACTRENTARPPLLRRPDIRHTIIVKRDEEQPIPTATQPYPPQPIHAHQGTIAIADPIPRVSSHF